MHVHLLKRPQSEKLRQLREALPKHVKLTTGPTQGTGTFELLVAGFPSAEDLAASPNLRTLIIPWSGLPEPTREALRQHPNIAVHNIHHNADAVAETALTLLLSVAKQTLTFDTVLRQHNWGPRYDQDHKALLLRGKQALILGYGAIGQKVAILCKALGMTVKATRQSLTEMEESAGVTIHPSAHLRNLLPETHALLICLPLTDKTRGLIGNKEFELLPTNAVIVNVGRGPIVDEEALYNALQNHQIFGAGIDVWYQYPKGIASRSNTPPSRFPFEALPNVVMSPHRADHTDEIEGLRMTFLAELLTAAANDKPIPNPVHVERGY